MEKHVLILLIFQTIIPHFSLATPYWKIEVLKSLVAEYYHRSSVVFIVSDKEGEEFQHAQFSKKLSLSGISSSFFSAHFVKSTRLNGTNDYRAPVMVVMTPFDFPQKITAPTLLSDKWLFFTKDEHWIENLNIRYTCKFVVASEEENFVSLKEYYKVHYTGPMLWSNLGQWSARRGLEISKESFIRRRFDFQGANFTYLITTLNPCSNLSLVSWNIFLCRQLNFWNAIVDQLNITARPTLSTNRFPIYLSEMFKKGVAQVSINGWAINYDSLRYVSFLWPTHLSVMDAFTRTQGTGIGWQAYLQPFHRDIWLATASWIFVCSVSIFLYRLYFLRKPKSLCGTEDSEGRLEQIWTPLFALFAQGCSEPATSSRERLLILAAFAVPAILIPAYNASLTSFLAIQVPITPIIDLQSLLDNPEYKISSVSTIDLRLYVQGNSTVLRHLRNKAIPPTAEQPRDEEVGMRRMCADKFTMVAGSGTLPSLNPPCQYYKMRKPFFVFYQSLTTPKNSPFKSAFDIVIRRMEYSGVSEVLWSKLYLDASILTNQLDGTVDLKSVTLIEVTVLIVNIAFAIFISLTILLYSLHQRNRKALSLSCISSTTLTIQQYSNYTFDGHQHPIVVALNFSMITIQPKNSLDLKSDKWLVFGDENSSSYKLNIPYHTKFILAYKQSNQVELVELVKISHTPAMHKQVLGYWTPTRGLEISKTWFIHRRINFKGAQFTYLITNLDPCSHLSFESWNVFLCIQYTIWNTIVKQLNITAKPTLSLRREPEYLAKMFSNGSAHVSVNGWSITSLSLQHVSFMWPTFYTELEAFTKVQGMAIGWDRYLQPFTADIWVAVAGWLVICSLSILIYRTISLQFLPVGDETNCRLEQIWTPLFAFSAQGFSEPATGSKERLLLLTALAMPLVVVPAYSAALTSFLAIQVPATPIMDLHGLLDHPEFKISSVRTMDVRQFFQGNDVISQHLMNHAILPYHQQPEDEAVAVRKMCAEKFTLIDGEVPVVALRPPCQYYKMRKPIAIFYQSLTLPKQSPYKAAFNTVIRKMELSGVTKALKLKTALKVALSPTREKKEPHLESVTIEEVAVLLASLACAIIASLSVLVFELIFFALKKHRECPYLN